MIRGTTPKLIFTFPYEAAEVSTGYITIQQGGRTVLEVENTDWEYGDGTISAELSQADTLKLKAGSEVKMQIRVKTADGQAIASNIVKTTAEEILKNGEI